MGTITRCDHCQGEARDPVKVHGFTVCRPGFGLDCHHAVTVGGHSMRKCNGCIEVRKLLDTIYAGLLAERQQEGSVS